MRLAASYCLHDDHWYLEPSIKSFSGDWPVFAFVSEVDWSGNKGDVTLAVEAAERAGAQIICGQWDNETKHRQAVIDWLKEHGFTHTLIPDSDEFIDPSLLEAIVKVAEHDLADRVFCELDTYWRSPEYVIRPREYFTPTMLINVQTVNTTHHREYEGGRPLLLNWRYGLMHHLSYAGPDERIRKKVSSWGHKDEVVPNWYERVWLRWPHDKLMRDFHPTRPNHYGYAERIPVPELLKEAAALAEQYEPRQHVSLEKPAKWPTVSIVIPLHGGTEELKRCLDSLEASEDLIHELIIVDNASPDDAAKEAKRKNVKLIKNKENAGFAKACNQGAQVATGEVVLFLNSDTIVPRIGLIRLIEAQTFSRSIAAAGPYTNNAGHLQMIGATYTSYENIDLFAEDFALRNEPDRDVDMLVGFCMAVRKDVLEEQGGFDERFGIGMFEDNDLSYRIRRAGYRLVIASRSFVHHEGSKTLERIDLNAAELFESNRKKFLDKWRPDVELGYASHLSGLAGTPIEFKAENKPESRKEQARQLAKQADISLCMIVRDEERVIRDCLESAGPFFREMIVVDTGSQDRTIEISRECGATVYEFPWTDSFSEARNESLKYAKGKWVYWMDADDTLPFACGEELLRCAIESPPDVAGYIVPVRFTDEGPAGGVEVDHVKLFRNKPDIRFQFRIHEQILHCLKPYGQIARSNAFVWHSGYDTSPEGQKKKRERDEKLLKLDLKEHPNHPFVLFNLGMTAHYLDDHEDAVSWLRKSLEVSEKHESHVRKAYALLAKSLQRLNKEDEAAAVLKESLELTPDDPELNFYMAQRETALRNYDAARDCYLNTLNAETSGHFSSVDKGIMGFKTMHNLAQVEMLAGRYSEARTWWSRAMEASPNFLPSAFCMFDAAVEVNDFATSKAMLDRVLTLDGPSESWSQMTLKYGMAVSGTAGALQLLEKAIGDFPQSLGPRIVFARKLLEEGAEARAQPHLKFLEHSGVGEAAYCLGICSIRRGQYTDALKWMERALELNPSHAETVEQVRRLREMLSK